MFSEQHQITFCNWKCLAPWMFCLFLISVLMFCRALFFAYCYHLMVLLDPWTLCFYFVWLPSYCESPSQLSHGIWVFLPNITLVGLISCSRLWSSIMCEDQGGYICGPICLMIFWQSFHQTQKGAWLNLLQRSGYLMDYTWCGSHLLNTIHVTQSVVSHYSQSFDLCHYWFK